MVIMVINVIVVIIYIHIIHKNVWITEQAILRTLTNSVY